MDELQKKALKSVWGLAVLSLCSIVLTRELGLELILLIAAAAPTAYYYELKNKLVKRQKLETFLILLLFVFSAVLFLTTKITFLISVAYFLIGFILLKLCFKKDSKDLMQVIALTFFILLSASTLALDFSFLFSFILYIIAATWTLSLYTISASPNISCVTQNSTRLIYKFLFRNCILTLILAILFTIGIFIFFPRLSLAVFQGAFLGPAHSSGFTERMNLIQTGRIFEDRTIVMRVEMNKDARSRLPHFYMRGQALSYFNGSEWSAAEKKGWMNVQDAAASKILKIQKLVPNQFQVLSPDQDLLKNTFNLKLNPQTRLRQKIYLETMEHPLLFGVPWIDTVIIKLPHLTVLEDHSILRSAQFSGRTAYEVFSFIERPSEKVLAKQAPISEEFRNENEISANLQVPDLDLRAIRALTEAIVSQKDSPYEKAKKIEKHLRKNYGYTLNIKTKNLDNPVQEFLMATKQGHCEYFSSAMALMLRLENIPARIVTGFVLNEWNPDGNYYTVRSKDAHSWVEVYIGGLWIEMDPSPRFYEPELGSTPIFSALKRKIDYWNFLWNAYILGYDMESQKKIAKTVELKSSALSSAIDRRLGDLRLKIWDKKKGGVGTKIFGVRERFPDPLPQIKNFSLPFIFLIGSCFFLAIFIVSKLKGRIRSVQAKQNHLDALYHETLKLLEKRGFKKKESETPNEFLLRVRESIDSHWLKTLYKDEAMHSLQFITEDYYRLRYACVEPTQKDLDILAQASKNLKHFLKRSHHKSYTRI